MLPPINVPFGPGGKPGWIGLAVSAEPFAGCALDFATADLSIELYRCELVRAAIREFEPILSAINLLPLRSRE
jgi:hypothetical protein